MEHPNKGRKQTPEHIAKRVTKQLGLKRTPEQRKRMSNAWKPNNGVFTKGHKHSEKAIVKIKEARKKQIMPRGENSWTWKGGITPINKILRASKEYHLWRTAVFVRDNRKCVWCGSKKDIQADHIKPFAKFPELRFAIDNGRTLCFECHKTTDTYGWKSNNY